MQYGYGTKKEGYMLDRGRKKHVVGFRRVYFVPPRRPVIIRCCVVAAVAPIVRLPSALQASGSWGACSQSAACTSSGPAFGPEMNGQTITSNKILTHIQHSVLPDGQKQKVPRETKKVPKKVPTNFYPKMAI